MVRRVGAGAFGKVYLAVQYPARVRVAIKLLVRTPVADPNDRKAFSRFEGEARALAVLDHPNVVPIHRYGVLDGNRPYIVMQYVKGGRTLKEVVSERLAVGEALSYGEINAVIGQVLGGLEAAHSAKIIHRDIKPDNMMIQELPDNPLHIRLVDFGLAKFFEHSDQTSMVAGTLIYMAPEQLVGRELGPWTDLYAVGVLAFQLLCGRDPYPANDQLTLTRCKGDATYDPTSLAPEGLLTPALRAFLTNAMALSPVYRFQTAAEMRTAWRDAMAAHLYPGVTGGGEASRPSAAPDFVAPLATDRVSGPSHGRGTVHLPTRSSASAPERGGPTPISTGRGARGRRWRRVGVVALAMPILGAGIGLALRYAYRDAATADVAAPALTVAEVTAPQDRPPGDPPTSPSARAVAPEAAANVPGTLRPKVAPDVAPAGGEPPGVVEHAPTTTTAPPNAIEPVSDRVEPRSDAVEPALHAVEAPPVAGAVELRVTSAPDHIKVSTSGADCVTPCTLEVRAGDRVRATHIGYRAYALRLTAAVLERTAKTGLRVTLKRLSSSVPVVPHKRSIYEEKW